MFLIDVLECGKGACEEKVDPQKCKFIYIYIYIYIYKSDGCDLPHSTSTLTVSLQCVLIRDGFRGRVGWMTPEIRSPCRPKGSPFVLFLDIHFS